MKQSCTALSPSAPMEDLKIRVMAPEQDPCDSPPVRCIVIPATATFASINQDVALGRPVLPLLQGCKAPAFETSFGRFLRPQNFYAVVYCHEEKDRGLRQSNTAK